MKSRYADPLKVTYKNALYAVEYAVTKVVEGEYEGERVKVMLWAFRDRKLQPSSRYQEGVRQRLTLIPFDDTELTSLQQFDDGEDFLLIPYWAEEVEGLD
jgi:hypothetical protein